MAFRRKFTTTFHKFRSSHRFPFQQQFRWAGSGQSASSFLFRPWHAYMHAVDAYPLVTAVCTGGTLWCIGDVIAQKVIERKPDGLDFGRLAGTITYGILVCGAASLKWYAFLDKQVLARGFKPKTLPFVAAKITPELCMWQPLTLCVFWVLVGVGEGKTVKESLEELYAGFVDGMKVEWSIWGPVNSCNFMFVPVPFQVLVVNIACLFEAITLSYLHSITETEGEGDGAAIIKQQVVEEMGKKEDGNVALINQQENKEKKYLEEGGGGRKPQQQGQAKGATSVKKKLLEKKPRKTSARAPTTTKTVLMMGPQ